MKQYLLPVWSSSASRSLRKRCGLGEAEWWDKAPFNYPHGLLSYVHWKTPFRFPEGAHIFGDSGGFSLNSQTMAHQIDPVEVIRWQASLCTVGCALDLPPTHRKERIWGKGLKVTVAHTARALPEYQRLRAAGTKFRWWGVLHGNNEAEVRQYHDAISAVYPFEDEGEGWAVRAEPRVDIYAVTRTLRILKSLGITRAHFLAATSQKVMAVLLALGPPAGLEFLTYDSMSAAKGGFNRHLWKPRDGGITYFAEWEQGTDHKSRDWVRDVCPCAVCVHLRAYVAEVKAPLDEGGFNGWWSTWFVVHNVYLQKEIVAEQERAAAASPEQFLRKMLEPVEYSTVMRIFEEDGHEPSVAAPTGTSRSLLDFLA